MTTPHESPAPAGGSPRCDCPEYYHVPDCQHFRSCGGWSWDPPCGGCDLCMMMQDQHAKLSQKDGEGQ